MLSRSDQRNLLRAIELAHMSLHRFRLGAVVVRKGNVMGHGVNRRTNDPTITDYTLCSVHAEQAAIKASGNTEDAVMYIARVGRKGQILTAAPCNTCITDMIAAGIKRVVYTTNTAPISVRIRDLV